MNSIYSILIMAIGSICAASFYVPIKKIKQWSWESYWLIQGIFSWVLIPIFFAWATFPSGALLTALTRVDSMVICTAVFYGILWGIGGLTFGLSMRYLGVALGQSISLGLCAALGTIIPPILAGENLFASKSGLLILAGVSISLVGITLIGYAGSLKASNLSTSEKNSAITDFALKKGLLIAILAGVMSACFNFGLTAGFPLQQIALEMGANPLFAKNPVIMLVTLGGFFSNLFYCLYLNQRNKTWKDYRSVSPSIFIQNTLYAALGGTLWYLQFFFMGMGESKLPPKMTAFSWSILMAMNIAFGNIWGLLLKEWKGVTRPTLTLLIAGIIILILSTFVIKL